MNSVFKNTAILCVLIALALVSCKKDMVLPESNEPVFTLNGTLGANAISLVAGDNNAFMSTMTEMENGVQVFSGSLSNGNLSVQIGVYDGYIDKPNFQPVDGMANDPVFSMDSGAQPLTILAKEMMQNSTNIYGIVWFIDGNWAGNDSVAIWNPGLYHVCAEVTFASDMSTATICEDLIIGYTQSANCSIYVSSDQNGNISADVLNMGTEAIQYVTWFMDGLAYGTTQGPPNMGANVSMINHYIEAEVHFDNGVVRKKAAWVDASFTGQRHLYGLTNFEMNGPGMTGAPRDFNVIIKINENGTEYRSDIADNTLSSISLLGLEYYDKNSNGKDVYKITLNIDANVMQVGGANSIPVNFTTSFGLEIEP